MRLPHQSARAAGAEGVVAEKRNGVGCTHRTLSSSFLGLPYNYRTLNRHQRKEQLRGPWVGFRVRGSRRLQNPFIKEYIFSLTRAPIIV